MSWALKGLAAPLKDKVFKLKPGITMGRQGDIVVPDTKSSSIHARIVVSDGKWFLTDNNSKNGTRIDGQRISKAIRLKPGLKFYIGDQGFEVLVIKEVEDDLPTPPPSRHHPDENTPPPAPRRAAPAPKKPAPAATQPKPKAAPPPKQVPLEADPDFTRPPAGAAAVGPAPEVEIEMDPDVAPPAEFAGEFSAPEPEPKPEPKPQPVVKKRRYWHEILADFVGEHKEKFSDVNKPITPLTPALMLEFVRGVQANTAWTLGYGPRKIGSSTLDLPIWEPGAPPICFEILSSAEGLVFKTAHPNLVTINGEALDSRVLHVGDKIRINETIIEVDFEQ